MSKTDTDFSLLRDSFHGCPIVNLEKGGYGFILNPLTEQVPATSPELLEASARLLLKQVPKDVPFNKIVGEEDRGAILVAAVSLLARKPLALARWNPSGVPGQIQVPFGCEYTQGTLYLNGVERGDRVVVVDDLISTGGTLCALLRAIHEAGAEVVATVVVAEKANYGGPERIARETGITPRSLLQLDVSGSACRVL
eukprot:gnl/Trimastix_PCT/4668.p1 GENE.gnl/Trimastix_PCT/4668~~gnl/Trimastix_PCT/4668.p1  ORF type:complete len:214 (+),score=34.27 gnl/Trimastix_PCT/4668:52-642(+)